MKLIYEKSQPGRRASHIPQHDGLPAVDVPEELRRADPPRLPEVPEFELMRHFTELSTRNFGVDTGFYPLGSCTMKTTRASTSGSRTSPASATCIRCKRKKARRARSS